MLADLRNRRLRWVWLMKNCCERISNDTLPFDADVHYEEINKRIQKSQKKENVISQVADTKSSYQGTGEHQKRWDTNW